jgi:predicted TIM-barrel fold metal-dependent hydrolase
VRAMDIYRRIVAHGRPILFHSGILSDTTPSGRYNRPVEFECLLEVDGLRFALAHMSWPWCDELIAVYYKFGEARQMSSDVTAEMFVDLTPGTPRIYRRDALTKLYGTCSRFEDNVFFGSDRLVHRYDPAGVRELIERDTAIFNELGLTAAQQAKVFGQNVLRFIGAEATSG